MESLSKVLWILKTLTLKVSQCKQCISNFCYLTEQNTRKLQKITHVSISGFNYTKLITEQSTFSFLQMSAGDDKCDEQSLWCLYVCILEIFKKLFNLLYSSTQSWRLCHFTKSNSSKLPATKIRVFTTFFLTRTSFVEDKFFRGRCKRNRFRKDSNTWRFIVPFTS